jgi:hypothetical protein
LFIANNVVSADVVRRNPQVAEAALRLSAPVFIHGDLQVVHVLDDGDEVSGQGDAMYDLATLTLAHEEHLDDVMAGYRGHIEIDVIRAYWSLRSLIEIRWLVSTATARDDVPAGRGAELLVGQRRPLFGRRWTPGGTTPETPLPFRRRTTDAGVFATATKLMDTQAQLADLPRLASDGVGVAEELTKLQSLTKRALT